VNSENIKKLEPFLQLTIEISWVEKSYKYTNDAYKIIIENLSNDFENIKFKIIIVDVAEQDLPYFGDKLSGKINVFLSTSLYKKKVKK
jgi:uncharacterized protein (UPF0212 family)